MTSEGKLCSKCKKGHYHYHHTGVHGYNGAWSPLVYGEYAVYECNNCGHRSYERVQR